MDSVIVAHECLDSKFVSGEAGVVCKLDFQKAYDNVSWSFLDYVLQRMDFRDYRWIWMRSCLSSAHLFVLVNGSRKGFYRMEKGVRQGDPLSPYLYAIVVEALHLMFQYVCSQGLIHGFGITHSDIEIPHLQYVNDIVLFLKADKEVVKTARAVLVWFQIWSRLKINFDKSELLGVNVDHSSLFIWHLFWVVR